MGLEPLRAEAKRTLGRGPQRATGAPSVGVARQTSSICPHSELGPEAKVATNANRTGCIRDEVGIFLALIDASGRLEN